MTLTEEKRILEGPITYQINIIHEILELTKDKDVLDAYYASQLATDILESRLNRVFAAKKVTCR